MRLSQTLFVIAKLQKLLNKQIKSQLFFKKNSTVCLTLFKESMGIS